MVFSFKFIFLLTALFYSSLYGQETADQSTLVYPQFKHAPIRKVGKYYLLLYAGTSTKIRNPQGLAVVKLNSRDDPDVSKDDDEITVYGINSDDNTIIFNNSLLSIAVYGKNLPNEQSLKTPRGITANADGRILVADTGNNRIVELKDSGTLLFVRSYGKKGIDAGEFNSPSDVQMDSQGNFYVVDSGNNRIQIFSADGELMKIWGEDDDLKFQNPISIAVTDPLERWSYNKAGFSVIIDEGGKTLKKISSEGELIKEVSGKDFGFPNMEFTFLAIDFYNNIYATDQKNHVIYKFRADLTYLTTFGAKGKDKNEFIEPRGIGIWRRLGQVIIAEKETVQYYLIGTDLLDVKLDNNRGNAQVSGILTERSYLDVDVFDSKNNFVKRLSRTGKKYGPGKITFRWNMMPGDFTETLKEISGYKRKKEYPVDEKVPPGNYKMVLKSKATYSSKKYFTDKVELLFELNENREISNIELKE